MAVYSDKAPESCGENTSKGRDKGKESIKHIVKDNDFKYIILPAVEKDILRGYRSKLACICSFLMENYTQNLPVQNLLVDGEIEDSFEKDLYKGLDTLIESVQLPWRPLKNKPDYITVEPKADTTYTVVNQADRVAYQLKNYHEEKGKPHDRYLENKLNPDWKEFKELFDYIGVKNK